MTQHTLFTDSRDGPYGDICAHRSQGNAESAAAFQRTNRSRDRERILECVRAAGQHGLTVEEIADRLGMRYTTASARCSELKRDGLLRPAGRRATRTGSMAGVLVT